MEAPRFQTRHLVSSFDNHAMSPGSLLLDERIAAGGGRGAGRSAATRSRCARATSSGAAPVLIRLKPSGVIEAGADPYYFRALRRGRFAVRRAGRRSTATRSARACGAGRAEHLHRRQFLEIRRLARPDLLAASGIFRAAGFRRKRFEAECLREYAETFPTVCGDFAFYQFPDRGVLAPAVRADPGGLPLRLQGAGADHLQGVSRARALRPAGRHRERSVSGRAGAARDVPASACCRTATRRRC